MYGVWGGWLSEPLLTLEQLQDNDVQMWLQRRQALVRRLSAARLLEHHSITPSPPSSTSSSARQKYRSPPHPPLSQPRKCVKDESGSRQTALSNDFVEIISSDYERQLGLEKKPVMVLFWQKVCYSRCKLCVDIDALTRIIEALCYYRRTGHQIALMTFSVCLTSSAFTNCIFWRLCHGLLSAHRPRWLCIRGAVSL